MATFLGLDTIVPCRSFDYRAEKAVNIATALGANAFRCPAASYYAYFPTGTRVRMTKYE